jgi:biotin carboxyl carrier protein
MILDIAVGDRVRTVSVVRKGALLHVTLDGRLHVVDARRVSDNALSMLIQNGQPPAQRSIDAAFASRPHLRHGSGGQADGGDFEVHLLGRAIAVEIRQGGSFGRQRKEGAGAHGGGPQRVTAPMPGKIVRLLVKAGDEVKAKQGLVVVEAMKMENELRAARDGRVREVPAAEGQSVEAGAVLLIVE